jgi:hypothetical protein
MLKSWSRTWLRTSLPSNMVGNSLSAGDSEHEEVWGRRAEGSVVAADQPLSSWWRFLRGDRAWRHRAGSNAAVPLREIQGEGVDEQRVAEEVRPLP